MARISSKGFTLIETLIAILIVGVTITGLFGLLNLNQRLNNAAEQRVVALALANERMEMIRNLPYYAVGTQGGAPSGSLPPSISITRNGTAYNVATDIRYVDDPFDGVSQSGTHTDNQVVICHKPPGNVEGQQTISVGASSLSTHLAHGDSVGNCGSSGGNTTNPSDAYNIDYKQVRVAVTWNNPWHSSPIVLITYVAPINIEGGETGGTLDFQALNANGLGITDTTVHIVNTQTTPQIDISTKTNIEGRVVLPGLPPQQTSYQISVSKNDYTSEQTYDITSEFIPDSDHGHLSILENQVTTKTFYIDQIANLNIFTQDDQGAPLAAIPFHLQGTKTYGQKIISPSSTVPMYKFSFDDSTNPQGNKQYNNLEWDIYNLTIDGVATGYDIKETSEVLPITLNPDDNKTLTVTLVPHTDRSLRVAVIDSNEAPINNATITLTGPSGYEEQLVTGLPGQVFFADLPSDGTYTVAIDAPGFHPTTESVTVSSTSNSVIQLESVTP